MIEVTVQNAEIPQRFENSDYTKFEFSGSHFIVYKGEKEIRVFDMESISSVIILGNKKKGKEKENNEFSH